MSKSKKRVRDYSSSTISQLLKKRDIFQTNRTKRRMLLAARIDELRQEKGWNKTELAKCLGKQPSEITKWLSGTHNFTSDTLSDLETVFGKTISPKIEEEKEISLVQIVKVSQEPGKNKAKSPGLHSYQLTESKYRVPEVEAVYKTRPQNYA